MKRILNVMLTLTIIGTSAQAQTTLTGTPSTDVVLSDDCYFLDGCYIIQSGVTLEINPGVTILAREDAALIVEPGGRIEASGTANSPIVFTTDQTAGTRTKGYWLGVQIAGDDRVNNGAIDLFSCSSTQAGGTDDNDDSGWLEYVQIHFAGQDDPADDERIEAGLSLLAVGTATEIENVQVSNSATNGINIAGGTVNAKWVYLLDNDRNDVFITDGHTGNLQGFYAERRSTAAHHTDGSNGVVIQNNGDGDNALPNTRPVISNFTIHGPLHCAGSADADFENALQLQNNARADIWNSFFGYYPLNGVHIEDEATIENTASNELNISFTSLTDNGNNYSHTFTPWFGNGCSNTMADWIEHMTAGCSDQDNEFGPFNPNYNSSFCGDYCDGMFVPDFTLNSPVPLALQNPDYSDGMLSDFDELDFRGAIQDVSIFDTWITVCPVDAAYCNPLPKKAMEAKSSLYLYPNPTQSYTDVRFESQTSGKAIISIMDKVSGRIWQQMEVSMEQTGQQQFRVPVGSLPENVYILQVSTASETLHGQLLIQ